MGFWSSYSHGQWIEGGYVTNRDIYFCPSPTLDTTYINRRGAT